MRWCLILLLAQATALVSGRALPRPRRAALGKSRPAAPAAAAVARGGGGGGGGLVGAAAPLWGVLGVTAMLLNAVKRLAPVAAEPFAAGAAPLSAARWALYVGFAASMAYAEGYKAFHLKFSPMVVARSLTLRDGHGGAVGKALAPAYAMGLFHATKKRRATSWGFLVGVACLVRVVKKLAYPARAIVDGGVVAGLSVGSASIAYHYVRALGGVPPPADAALP